MEFNVRLKECRNKKGWTQEGISKILNIKRPRYAKYETGENQPDYRILIKLADLFGVSTDYLLGRHQVNHYELPNDEIKLLINLNNHLKNSDVNIQDVVDIVNWHYLNKEHIKEILDHINWVVYKAKKDENE